MGYCWTTCPSVVKEFVFVLQNEIMNILQDDFIGFYLHGSLAMGGFNPNSSDIDILVITKESMKMEDKRNLAQFFLNYSNSPYPIEISFLNNEQLKHSQHPFPFDFHYSEFWRDCYEKNLLTDTYHFLYEAIKTDADLAAHITITKHKGICMKGKPIDDVFPNVPKSDYIKSIMSDYQYCIENIVEDPIYCSLNLIRVFWYLKEGVISSKQEAGIWGLKTFPQELIITIRKVLDSYGNRKDCSFDTNELEVLKDYISIKVQALIK